MKHDIKSYTSAVRLMGTIDDQLSENLIARMDSDFDKTLEERNHKKRAKLVKEHHRYVKEISPVNSVIYPMQVRMIQIKTNLGFVLENACYNLSYKAIAKYFAEYDFLSQQVKKEAKKVNNEIMKDFLARCDVLEENFFQILMDSITVMEENVIERMNTEPETYINLDVEEDSRVDFDEIKATYKDHLKKLKEDLKKQQGQLYV